MLPISKKLIPGEVQAKSGVMSLRRAGFSFQPPVPRVPSAEMLCPVPVPKPGTDRSGTGATCFSSAAPDCGLISGYIDHLLLVLKKHRAPTMVKICSPGKHGCAGRPGLALLPQPGIVRLQRGSLRALWPQTWTGSATYRGAPPPPAPLSPPASPRGLASGGEAARAGAAVTGPGRAFVLLPPPCGHEFSFLPGLSVV